MMAFFLIVGILAIITNILLKLYDTKYNDGKLNRKRQVGKKASIHAVGSGEALLLTDNLNQTNDFSAVEDLS
jgi:hypothetical protein